MTCNKGWEFMGVHGEHLKPLVHQDLTKCQFYLCNCCRLDEQKHQRKESSMCFVTDVLVSEILRVQEVLRGMDTSCHVRFTCNLVCDCVLLPIKPSCSQEAAKCLFPKQHSPLIQVTMHYIKPTSIIVGQTIFLGLEKERRCFFSLCVKQVSKMYCLPWVKSAGIIKDEELMYWAAPKHLPSTPKQSNNVIYQNHSVAAALKLNALMSESEQKAANKGLLAFQ